MIEYSLQIENQKDESIDLIQSTHREDAEGLKYLFYTVYR